MPRVRVGWIFVAVVFLSVFKEEITADVADLPEDLTQIDAENLDGHVEISTLDVLPTTTPEQEHSTTHRTKKFLKWPSRRPLFKKHNGRDSTLKTNEFSSMAANQESYTKEIDSTTEIQKQTTQLAETTPAKLHNRGSYRFIPPKSSLPSGRSSSTTTTELPPYTRVTLKGSSAEKSSSNPKFRKFLMRTKLESPSHSSENVKNETSSGLSMPSRALKLETSVNSGIVTGAVEVSSKHQKKQLSKGDEVVELTKALLESEQNDQEKFFKETGTETDETLFESDDPAESDLFEIDQNYNKFLMTEKPLEKVTVLLPASFNVKDLKTNHDFEDSATISSDIQHPSEQVNEGVEEISNLEATVSSKTNPVDETHIGNSAGVSSTTTTEHDKLSRLHKFLNNKSRYHSRARFGNNVNENSTKYLDRTTTEYTSIENNAELEDSATIQPTKNNFVDTTSTKHKIPFMHKHLNLKHENSTKIQLADATAEEKLTETHDTTEHNKVLHMHQLVDGKSKESFTSQLKDRSVIENSTDVKFVQHPQIIHMHRLTHMKPKKTKITTFTENSINGTSSEVNKNLAKHDVEEGVTMSSDIQHPNEKGNKESEGISITTMKYVDEIFNLEATDTTDIPVDKIIEDSANATSTSITTERDRLSRLHTFLNKKSRYHSRASFDNNVNENFTRYLDRTTTEFTTIQNNAETDSATIQTTENSFADTTRMKHKIPFIHKHLSIKHENSTEIHFADTTVEEKLTENHAATEHYKVPPTHQLVHEKLTSQLKGSSPNENSTDMHIVQTKNPQIIHMHRLPHMKPKKFTITPLTENVINGSSSNVNKNLATHDVEHVVTMSSDVQHLTEKGNKESEGISITTMKYVDEIFNLEATDTTEIPVDEVIEDSANATSTSTTTERDRLSRLHTFLNKKSRYHSRASFDNNVNENFTRYLDRTTIEFTTMQNNAETDSTTIQMTENSFADTTRMKHKIPFIHKHLSIKHENSTEIHFADTTVEEKLTENHAATEHYKVPPTHQLVHEKLTSQLKGSSPNENSTDMHIVQTKHPQIIHMHRLPHMKPKKSTITPLTENVINGSSSNVNKNLATHDVKEGVTIFSDVQHPNEKGNEESEEIPITTMKYVDEIFNLEATDTTEIPVDKIIEDSADASSTSTTTERDRLSRLHKFLNKKSQYHSRASFDNNVNRTTTDFTTIQNNAGLEDSITVQPTENSFADTTSREHKIPHIHKHLDLKHEQSTKIHLADTNVEEQPTENAKITEHKKIPRMNQLVEEKSKGFFTSQLRESSLNENATDPTEHPKIIHMHRLPHIKPKNSTITPLTENGINGTSSEHKIIRMPKYPNWKHNNFTLSHLIGNSTIEDSTDANKVIEQNKTFAVHRIRNMNQKNFTETHLENGSFVNENTTRTEHKSIRIQKYLNVKPNNATATHYSDNRANETSDDENIVATHKTIHMPRLLNITPKYLTKTHIIENGLNESSVDEMTTSPEHKILQMPKNLDIEHRNSTTTYPSKHRVFENSADGNTSEHHKLIHTQHLHTKPKSSITTDSTKKSDNENPVDANIAPMAHKIIHMHKFLNPKLKNVTSTLIAEKKEIDYNKMIHMKQLIDIKPSIYHAESSVDEISTDASTVTPQSSEVTREHQYVNKKPEESLSDSDRYKETKKTSPKNIQTVSSTHKAHYSFKPSGIEITQTPDYTSTITEEVIDENSDRVIESTSEEEITGSTHYVYEEITTSPDISTETDNSSEFSEGTSSSVPSIRTAITENKITSELISSTERPIASTRYNNEEITTDSEIYTDAQVLLAVSTETSSSSTRSPTTTNVKEISNTIQYIDDPVTTSEPLQQVVRDKSTIPRTHYLFKRTTTASPIITGQEYGQEESVTESIITSAIIHLQIHNETGSLLLNSPTLTETTTLDAPDIKNEDFTDELYSAETSPEPFFLATESVNEVTLVTLDPAEWYGVNIDITTEVPADEINTDFDKIDADIDEEKTSIAVDSIGSETANTTTILKTSTKQREPLANNKGKLDDTSESVEIQEFVTVDPAHWYGVEYGTESGEKVEAAVENTITLNNESETETEQNITIGDTTSGSVIEIDSRFGGNVNFTSETDLSALVLNNVEGVMNDNTTEETFTTGVTVITQNETTVGESLQTKKTTDQAGRNENRDITQSGFEENHSDHQEELHESIQIETTKAANISTSINDINQTIILGGNDKIGSTTKKSSSLSTEVMREQDKVGTSSPNAFLAENITDLPKLSDLQAGTITSSIASNNGNDSLDDAVREISKTEDTLTVITETSKLPSSNSSKMGTEYEKHVEVNTVDLDVGSEFNNERNITKLKEDGAPEGSTNSIPVTETVEANVSVLEKVQFSEVALKNTVESADNEDKDIELGTEQKKMLFEKLGEVFESNEDMNNVSYGIQHNGSESASFNNSFTLSEVDKEAIEDDEETEEDDDVESEYMDLYALDKKNHEIQDVQEVSYVAKNILGNAANFSVQVKMKQQTIQMPSDVHISEDPKHLVLNFTWPSSENTYNYSLSLHLNESTGRYLINKMHLNFVKDDLTVKESDEHQGKDESFVDLGEDIQVIFSNTDFLRISKQKEEEETSEDYQRAKKERQARVLHMEIILGAVIVIGVIVLVIYILIARRRKLRSPKVEDKDVSSRL